MDKSKSMALIGSKIVKSKSKDCNIKKETNLDAYISVNFSHILTNSAPQKMQIFPAFHRDALY